MIVQFLLQMFWYFQFCLEVKLVWNNLFYCREDFMYSVDFIEDFTYSSKHEKCIFWYKSLWRIELLWIYTVALGWMQFIRGWMNIHVYVNICAHAKYLLLLLSTLFVTLKFCVQLAHGKNVILFSKCNLISRLNIANNTFILIMVGSSYVCPIFYYYCLSGHSLAYSEKPRDGFFNLEPKAIVF